MFSPPAPPGAPGFVPSHRRRRLTTFLMAALVLAPSLAMALDGRLLLPSGKPAVGTMVSIAGVPGSVTADAQGRFRIATQMQPPLTLIAIGSGGEIFPPVTITEVPSDGAVEIQLEAGFREEMTVTSGVAPNIEAPPASGTAVVGREDLEERRPEHLVDALARTAGVQIRGEGPAAVPVLRGLAGGRTLILVDDARITTERRAGASATFLDPFSLASVEVSRGPGSVAYGSDALGGVIHARPRDPVVGDSVLGYHANIANGGRESRSAGVEFSHDVPGGALLGLVHAREGQGSRDGEGNPILNSQYEDRGVSLRFLAPRPNGMFRAALAVDAARNVGAPGADALVTRTYYPDEDSRRLTLSWDGTPARFFNSVEMRASLSSSGVTTNRERLPNGTAARQLASAEVDANDTSLRMAGTRMTSRGRFHTGIDFVSRFNLRAAGFTQSFNSADAPTTRLSEVSIEDAQKRDLGFFALYDWSPSTMFSLSGGMRVDRVETRNSGGFFGSRATGDTALSGYASASMTPVSGLTATIQASSGYRDPTLSDRYFRGISGRGFVVGNPDLDPERSLQFDGALRFQRGQRSIALLGYQYRIRDLVERYRAGADFQFRNRGQADVRGLELEMATPLPAHFSLQIAAAIARGEAVDDSAPLDDISQPNAHVALRWAKERTSVFLHTSFFARDNRPGPVETERPGYATVDLGAGWRFSEQLEIRLHGQNLMDRTYFGSTDANASLAPGRSFSIGLNGRV